MIPVAHYQKMVEWERDLLTKGQEAYQFADEVDSQTRHEIEQLRDENETLRLRLIEINEELLALILESEAKNGSTNQSS